MCGRRKSCEKGKHWQRNTDDKDHASFAYVVAIESIFLPWCFHTLNICRPLNGDQPHMLITE